MHGISVSGMPRSSKTGPDPSLNQPNSDRTDRDREVTDSGHSGVDGACHTLRLSHSGFLLIFFTDFNNRPFSRILMDPVSKGSRNPWIRCQKGPDSSQKVPFDVHLRPLQALGPYPTGTWIYPTLLPGTLGLALATGSE